MSQIDRMTNEERQKHLHHFAVMKCEPIVKMNNLTSLVYDDVRFISNYEKLRLLATLRLKVYSWPQTPHTNCLLKEIEATAVNVRAVISKAEDEAVRTFSKTASIAILMRVGVSDLIDDLHTLNPRSGLAVETIAHKILDERIYPTKAIVSPALEASSTLRLINHIFRRAGKEVVNITETKDIYVDIIELLDNVGSSPTLCITHDPNIAHAEGRLTGDCPVLRNGEAVILSSHSNWSSSAILQQGKVERRFCLG